MPAAKSAPDAGSSSASTMTQADPLLGRLSDLLHKHAEIFAGPSTSTAGEEIYKQSLQVTKQLFDECRLETFSPALSVAATTTTITAAAVGDD